MDRFPPPWTHAAEAVGFWQHLQAAPRSVLMLDYDGTLAPFHQDRMQATVYPGVAERLVALSALANVLLVLVTGRSARELRGLLPPGIRADIWGSHGRELLKSDQSYKLFALDSVQQATLHRVIREMTEFGFQDALEIKPASLAVHWRNCEPAMQEEIRARIEAACEGVAGPGRLYLLPFDGGLELRSADRTKGTAVREILRQQAFGSPSAYLGDDLTDEDAFAALGDRGFSILVRGEVRRSSARFWLRPPQELLAFLDEWITAARSHHPMEAAAAKAPR